MQPLTSDQQDLATSGMTLAHSLMWPWKRRYPQFFDEIESAGLLGLCRAAGTFRPGRSAFASYAWICIRGAVRDAVIHERWIARRYGESTEHLRPLRARPEPGAGRLEIDELLDGFPSADLLRAAYLEGRTDREIAEETGTNQVCIAQRRWRALTALRALNPVSGYHHS